MVTNNHYRWDFIGLSTDQKPTPETSEKVVDGSTFYCSDNSKLYVYCKDNWYERKPLGGGGGGGGTSYTAGNGIDIADDTISVDTETIQEKLTAGSNITISDNTISATDTTYTAGSNITISNGTISATDTTYSNFTGTDGTAAGSAGLVPAPATTDAGKFLKADGTWDTAGGGGGPTVVQTTGTSTTDVMSQDATTSMVFADGSTGIRIRIGNSASTSSGSTIAIGNNSAASKPTATAIGSYAICSHSDSVGLGSYATTTSDGQISIKTNNTNHGYNHTYYKLLSGVYDGQDGHDAVNVDQINGLIDAINTALNVNISHIGAPTS